MLLAVPFLLIAQHRTRTEHEENHSALTGGERDLMTVAIYTRNALPNAAAYEWQRETCEQLAAELGYEDVRVTTTKATNSQAWTRSRTSRLP